VAIVVFRDSTFRGKTARFIAPAAAGETEFAREDCGFDGETGIFRRD